MKNKKLEAVIKMISDYQKDNDIMDLEILTYNNDILVESFNPKIEMYEGDIYIYISIYFDMETILYYGDYDTPPTHEAECVFFQIDKLEIEYKEKKLKFKQKETDELINQINLFNIY